MGGSSSSSASTNNNTDKRLAIGEGGMGVSGDHNTINMMDGGAFDFAKTAQAGSNQNFHEVMGATQELLKQGFSFLGTVNDNYSKNLDVVTKAYDSVATKNQTADTADTQQLMKIGGLVLVGVIAVNAFAKAA